MCPAFTGHICFCALHLLFEKRNCAVINLSDTPKISLALGLHRFSAQRIYLCLYIFEFINE